MTISAHIYEVKKNESLGIKLFSEGKSTKPSGLLQGKTLFPIRGLVGGGARGAIAPPTFLDLLSK